MMSTLRVQQLSPLESLWFDVRKFFRERRRKRPAFDARCHEAVASLCDEPKRWALAEMKHIRAPTTKGWWVTESQLTRDDGVYVRWVVLTWWRFSLSAITVCTPYGTMPNAPWGELNPNRRERNALWEARHQWFLGHAEAGADETGRLS